ncbi:MAG TPA: DUF2339 domain-containing protein [Planctomycetes bacterium]|nr:DUF2339 domain-containing protein [Planctomycetota bacterium]
MEMLAFLALVILMSALLLPVIIFFIVIRMNNRLKGIEKRLDSAAPQQPEPPRHATEAELPPPKPPQASAKSEPPTPKEPPAKEKQAVGEQTPAVEGNPPEAAMPPNSSPASGDKSKQSGKKPADSDAEVKQKVKATKSSLEQRIGTKWVNIVGIITFIVGICFFLKYAYEHWVTEIGRVIITTITGLLAISVGELTRLRGYGIVAKGVTALGFAILYAAVFSAYGFYGLIGSTPAFALSIIITAAALLYAVGLDEIVMAFLALLGGFLSPVILSIPVNRPFALFTYVSILSVGTMLCSFFRKWRAVNILALTGTFILYTRWFEKFYVPAGRGQLAVALVWLAVFFTIFLILPTLYELVKRTIAQREAPLLTLANAAIVSYYLYRILYVDHKNALALCVLAMAIAHLVMMQAIRKRCRADLRLQVTFLAIGLFCITVAIPLYFKIYAAVMAWSAQAVILALIGNVYDSKCTRIASFVALALSGLAILTKLPLHSEPFDIILNIPFVSCLFVGVAFYLFHLIYRRAGHLDAGQRETSTQLLHMGFVLTLFAACVMEWHHHIVLNLGERLNTPYYQYFSEGFTVILTASMLAFAARPFSPGGQICKTFALLFAGVGSVFVMIFFFGFHREPFIIFANPTFIIALIFVSALPTSAYLLERYEKEARQKQYLALLSSLTAVFLLWVLLTGEIYLYWYYRGRGPEPVTNWEFLAQMYISVMWALYAVALMVIGFWRKVVTLRYIALGLFTLALLKVFTYDMSTVESVYRIAGFIVLGGALIAVSFLYQYCKKKGFFKAQSSERSKDKD